MLQQGLKLLPSYKKIGTLMRVGAAVAAVVVGYPLEGAVE